MANLTKGTTYSTGSEVNATNLNALVDDATITNIISTDMADNAVTTTKINASAVTTAKLGADAVTGAKIADDTIDSEHYIAGSIDNEHLADNAVGQDEIDATALFAQRAVQLIVFDPTNSINTGDGAMYFHIDSRLNGMNLVDVHAQVITAGTTGTTDIQVYNLTQTADMLSTVITIDSGETGSDTAAAAAVIDTANDDVATNDVLRIDIDAVSTTAPKGLIVTLGFSGV